MPTKKLTPEQIQARLKEAEDNGVQSRKEGRKTNPYRGPTTLTRRLAAAWQRGYERARAE